MIKSINNGSYEGHIHRSIRSVWWCVCWLFNTKENITKMHGKQMSWMVLSICHYQIIKLDPMWTSKYRSDCCSFLHLGAFSHTHTSRIEVSLINQKLNSLLISSYHSHFLTPLEPYQKNKTVCGITQTLTRVSCLAISPALWLLRSICYRSLKSSEHSHLSPSPW